MLFRIACLIGLIAVCAYAVAAVEPDPAVDRSGFEQSEQPQAGSDIDASALEADTTSEIDTTEHTGTAAARFRFRPPPPVSTDFLYSYEAELDLERGLVTVRKTVGGVAVGPPKIQTLQDFMDEYIASRLDERLAEMRRDALTKVDPDEGLRLELRYDIPHLPPMARSIIGEGESTLRISGYGRITMGGRTEYTTGLATAARHQSKFPTLTMKQELSFQISGTIGSKIFVSIDQDTKRLSDLDNNIRIRYQGDEDEIIQEVELGNTNISLQGARFISGGRQHRGLFGIKSRAKLGDMEWTMIASQQKSSTQRKSFRGGAQETEIEIKDVDFIKNRFYWVDQFFRARYADAQRRLRENPNQDGLIFNPAQDGPVAGVTLQVVELYRYTTVTSGTQTVAVAIDDSMYSDAGLNTNQYDYGQLYADNVGVSGNWELLSSDAYDVETTFGKIDFRTSAPSTDIAARIFYRLAGEDQVRVFPSQTDSPGGELVLKLLAKQSPQPTDPSWKLMWRHVYDLRARSLSPDDLTLDIVEWGNPEKPNTPANSGSTYLTILKLDVTDNQLSSGQPNQNLDPNRAKIDFGAGLVTFPYLEPFWDAFVEHGLTADSEGESGEGVRTPYVSASQSDLSRDSRYAIAASYSQTSTRISLGFDILEDSEVVKLNGNILRRDVDYRINYFTGELEFLATVAAQVTQPGADLVIDYESNPLFKPDQETLLGARGVYRLGRGGQIGTTFMFNSERTSSFRVRAGEEPTRIMMLGADAHYEFEPYWLTAAVDRIPFVSTDERSQIRFEGELARSLPNLNTRGIAYIDDFEGAANISQIGLTRRGWTMSSMPLDPVTKVTALPNSRRAKLAWFNVVGIRYRESDVWDDVTPSAGVQEDTIELLHLWYRPENRWPRWEEADPSEDRDKWAGIMRSFGQSGVDLSQTQFIDIWMRVDTKPYVPTAGTPPAAERPGGSPVLRIDLGTISEEVLRFSDEQDQAVRFKVPALNSEDHILRGDAAPFPSDGGSYVTSPDHPFVANGFDDGFLNSVDDTPAGAGEDVGLDGCPDEYEDGFGGCFAAVPDVSLGPDPNRDNWEAPHNPANPRDYSRINGTDGNRLDGGGGLFATPDTEDLNGNGRLDRENRYVSYSIDLQGFGQYQVENTETSKGFVHYRIPIHELTAASVDTFGGTPSFNQITSMRMWIEGVEDEELWLTIASLGFVGNDWEELKGPDDEFAVTTVNRRTAGYAPPPEAEVEYDQYGQPRLQNSLSFQIAEIKPRETFRAQRVFAAGKDLTDYRRLKMYIHGPAREGFDPNWDHLSAFLRLGVDSTSYYEIRIPRLYPGWDPRNYVDVELDSLTNLKLTQSGEMFSGTDTTSTDGRFRIVGAPRGATVTLPTLSNVRMLQIGVVNESDHVIRTRRSDPFEVWFDDLHLFDARNTAGLATRANINVKMADLVTILASAEQQDASFRTLQTMSAAGASQQSSQSYQLTMQSFRVDKFLPADWRVQIPVSMTVGRSSSTPRLKPASDIVLVDEADKAAETRTRQQFSTNTSFSKTSRSRNPLIGATFDRTGMSVNYAVSKSTAPSATSRDTTRGLSYGGRFNYDLAPRTPRRAKPLEWMSPLLPDALTQTEVTYVPTTLRFDASTSFRYDSTRQQRLNLGFDSTYVRVAKSFNLSEAYRLQMQPVRSVTSSYDLTFSRDLQETVDGPMHPGEAAGIVAQNIFRNRETGRGHRFNLTYSPQWPSWFGHSYSYSNNYTDSGDLHASAGVNPNVREFSLNSQQQYNASSLTFRLKDVLNRIAGDQRTASRGSQNRQQTTRSRENGNAAPDSAVRSTASPMNAVRGSAGFAARHIDNVTGRVSYSDQFTGNQIPEDLRPGIPFQAFGIGAQPPLDAGANLGIVTNNRISRQLQWDVGSGIALPFRMRVTGKYAYREQRSFTVRDSTRSEDVTFPDLTYSWDGLASLPILSQLATSSDLRSAFQRTQTKQFTANEASNGEYLSSQRTSYRLSPLFAWNVLWKNRVRSTLRGTWDRSYIDTPRSGAPGAERQYSTTISTNWSTTVTATYELTTSQGIRTFGDHVWRLQGNINFSLDASYSSSHSYTPGGTSVGGDLIQTDTRTWSVKPRASYRFSRNFTGQAEIEVGQVKDRWRVQTRNIRAVSVSGELRFN